MAQQRYLLDTNILICALMAPQRLDSQTRDLLGDPESTIYFSAASLWEIAIKSSLNKIDFTFTAEDVFALAAETGFTELTIAPAHTFAVEQLPWYHRDPFDRLLIAQALSLPAYFMTSDSVLVRYSENVQYIVLK